MKKCGTLAWTLALCAALLVVGCSNPAMLVDGAGTGRTISDTATLSEGYAMGMGFAEDDNFVSETAPAARSMNRHGFPFWDSGKTIPGMDVSYYQKEIDWVAVRDSGIKFAFIRISDGIKHPDSQFKNYWPAAKAMGIVRGPYQFFRPAQDPVAQATLFLNMLGTLERDDMPAVIDVEVMDGQPGSVVVQKMRVWIDMVKKATGKTPIIYTSTSYWNALPDTAQFADCILWTANWDPQGPIYPPLWDKWIFWQSTDSGTVPGIGGKVDLDSFNGSLTELKLFARTGITIPPPPVTEFEKPFRRWLGPGTRGSDVKLLQHILNDWAVQHATPPVEVTGVFGLSTFKLLKAFQSSLAMMDTGVLSPYTAKKLVRSFTQGLVFYAPYTRTLKFIAPPQTGDDVRMFQRSYNVWAAANGKTPLLETGLFDADCKAAAMAFQNTEILYLGGPDGAAGRRTQRLLFVRSWQ